MTQELRLRIALVVTLAAVFSITLDSQIRFHLGDSNSFLMTSWTGWKPHDRPWIYGLLSSALPRLVGDLSFLPKVQVLATAVAGLGLALAMQARSHVGPLPAALIPLLMVFEPLSFWWARAVMSDSLATALFTLTLAAAIWPNLPSPLRFSLVVAFAVATFFLRSVLVPPVVVGGATYALACLLLGRWFPPLQAACREAFVVALAFLAAAGMFAFLNSHLLQQPKVALNHGSSRFLLSSVSPLLAGREAELPLPAESKAHLPPLDRAHRIHQAFVSEGLYEQLAAVYGAEGAEEQGRRLVVQALLFDPLRTLGLAATNWTEFLDPRHAWAYHRAARFSGAVPYNQPAELPEALIGRLDQLAVWQSVRPDLPSRPSPALWWFRWGGGVSSLILAWGATLAPLLVAFTPLRRRPEAWLMALIPFASMGFLAVTVNAYVTRYLISVLPPLACLLALALAARTRRGGASVAAPATTERRAQPT
jgi:hypothetical protein